MAKLTNTELGKGFEFTCLDAVRTMAEAQERPVAVVADAAFETARRCFEKVAETDYEESLKQRAAADAGMKFLAEMEPNLLNGEGRLELAIAADSVAIGPEGDVRDVICSRPDGRGWQTGVSCKHNHAALKHPRVTEGKDFGEDWVGIPCSAEFMREITPVTDSLMENKVGLVQWKDVPEKWDRYYVPILDAYMREIERMCDSYDDVPARLVRYFFGSNDFWKVIMRTRERVTDLVGFNMNGTLSSPCGRIRPATRIQRTTLPTRLIEATRGTSKGEVSKTTIVLTFDLGWTISLRLHNKDKIAKPTSLAWDVQLVGTPTSAFKNTRPWTL